MFKNKEDRLIAEKDTQQLLADLSPTELKEQAEREKEEREKADKLDYWTEAWSWAWSRTGREAA